MQEERHPQGHPKAQAQARPDLFRLAICEACLHDDTGIIRRSGLATLGIERGHVLGGVVNGKDLSAGHGRIVATGLTRDQRGEDHDQTQGDDSGQVKHGSQHPGAVLIDLETLDVVVRHADTRRRDDGEEADSGLGCQCAPKGASDDHHCTDVAHDGEDDDKIAVDAMDNEELMPYHRKELPNHQKPGGKNCDEVEGDANAVDAVTEPVPLAGRGAVGIAMAIVAGDVQVREAGEGEAE